MKKHLLFLSFICLLVFGAGQSAKAQFGGGYAETVGALAFQVTGGSQGVGLDARYGITEKLSARLGGSFLPVSANNPFTVPGFKSTTRATANFNNVHLMADYVPLENMQWLRVVGGVGYLYKATGSLKISPTGTYNVANYKIASDEMGTMDVGVSWKGVAPYLGFGFFNAFPSEFFNINVDLGTYYMSAAKSTVVGTKLLAENYQLEPQINQNLKGYRWLPVLQVNFNFKIK